MRLSLLDCLRGFAIVEMMAFHILYDINVVYGVNPDWPFLSSVHFWQQQVLLLFVFVSGMSFNLMSVKKQWLNALKLLTLGLLITLITCNIIPTESIYYGILSFLGFALLISNTLEYKHLLTLTSPIWGMTICSFLFLLTYSVQTGTIKLCGLVVGNWPTCLYDYNLAVLGFAGENFQSADYVPLLPHIFMYWLGYFSYRLIMQRCKAVLSYGNIPVLKCLGKHSLLIYLLHQPLLLAILKLIL